MKNILLILILLISIPIGYYLYNSYKAFKNSDYEQQGFLVCNTDNTDCENSQHIHADIELNACGTDIHFEKEKGRTDFQHTHKELNKLHWHAREKVDPITKEPLNKEPRMLKAFFEQMEYKLPEKCSDSEQSKIQVWINDIEIENGLDYIWKDGDKIKVIVR